MRTSLPVQESVDPNALGMLDALPDLSEAADKLLGCLVPRESSDATITSQLTKLHTKGTIASINWRRHGNAFQAQRELYGSDSYIDPSAALKALIGRKQLSETTSGSWRPDALFQKANLAVLASSIFTRPWQEQGDQFIEELEQAFPRYFTEALASSDTLIPGHSALIVETFKFALEVRTQYAITLLDRYSAQPNFDSDVVLHQVFYKNKDVLKGWGILGIHSENLTNEYEDAILKRLAQLRAAFTDFLESAIAGTERLRTTFPWNSFVHDTVAWISKRMKEIEAQIIASGGNQAICESLSNEVQRLRSTRPSMNYDDLVLNYEPPSEASNTASEHQNVASKAMPVKVLKMGQFKSVSLFHIICLQYTPLWSLILSSQTNLCHSVESPKAKKAAATLKRRMSNRQASKLVEQASADDAQGPASDIQVASTAEPSARAVTPQRQAKAPGILSSAPPRYHDEGWRAQEADDEDDGPLPALEIEEEVRMDHVLALRDRAEAESNKENIVETQTNLQPPSGQRRLIDRQENATRVAWDSQDTGSNQNATPADLDEVDEFQQQQLPVNATSRRSLMSSNKRTATEPPRSQGPSPKKVRIQTTNGARAQSIAQDRQSSRPPASQLEEYLAANAAAKERKAWQVKPPQVRKGWTEEETERLLELIEEHGTSWALLKNEDFAAGNILESRDQVALKDRARNLKLDYLKYV